MSSLIKTRMTIVKKIGAETMVVVMMVVVMMAAEMMVVAMMEAETSPTLRSLILSLLQGTPPLPPPAVPRNQVHVITVVAVGVNMSACGKSCFICTHDMVKVQMI